MSFLEKLVFSLLICLCVSLVNAQKADSIFENQLYLKLINYDVLSKNDWQIIDERPSDVPVSVFPFSSFFDSINVLNIEQPFGKSKKAMSLYTTFRLKLRLEKTQLQAVIRELNNQQEVEYAEPVYKDHELYLPNDPSYSSCWHLPKIQADLAWDLGVGDDNIVVSIVDDAITINHPDLQGVIWNNPGEIPNNGIDDDNNGYIDDIHGWDTYSDDNDPSPHSNTSAWAHGTHCAGIAGAHTNNNLGISAIGHGVSIMAVKTADNNGLVNQTWDGVYYSIVAGADVINCSWSSGSYSQTNNNIIQFGINSGCIIVAAAGNNNANLSTYPKYPACYNGVICVANTNSSDIKASSSNYGTRIDVSAPGSSILSTIPYNGYDTKTGTSMSSPMVAGLLGLMKSYAPSATNEQLISCLKKSADEIDITNPTYSGLLGSGRINAYMALNCLSPPTSDFNILIQDSCNGKVYFSSSSINFPDYWEWDFNNDGIIDDTSENVLAVFNQSGDYTTSLTVSNAFGVDSKELTNAFAIQLNPPPDIGNLYVCHGEEAEIEVYDYENLNWYKSENDLESIYTGPVISLGQLSKDTSLFVSNFTDTICWNSGMTTFSNSGTNSNTYSYLVFDVHQDLIIQSVEVKALGTQNREVIILDSNDNLIYSKVFSFSQDGIVTLSLNATLPTGNNYKIGLASNSNVNLYRANSGANFPYQIPDFLSINKSLINPINSTVQQYYYFFNWKVCESYCESARKEVGIVLDSCKGLTLLEESFLYPNPNQGQFFLRVPRDAKGEVMIFNQLGQIILDQAFTAQAERVPLNLIGIKKGVYNLIISVGESKEIKKFVVTGD